MVGQAVDVAFVFSDVELVFDLTHNFFQHVLDGDQARNPAKLVDDDGQVVAVAAKLAQQVVQAFALGHKHRRAQQRADVERRRALQLEQVLGHQNTDDVFTLAAVHRETRVGRGDHGV